MEQWFIVDADGFLVDAIMSDSDFQLEEDFRIVKKPWTDGMYKPRHNEETDEWESGETPEEKAAREALENQPKPPSLADKVNLLLEENTQLKDKNAKLEQRLSQVNGNFSAFTDQYYKDFPDKA